MKALHGPADASNFRIAVGRHKTRWYTDPLPACDIAPASDWHGPSVSTTKPPFANRYYTLRGIADMPSAEWARLAGLDAEARYEAVKVADKLAGRINMDRGTIVHGFAEDRLNGRTPIPGLDLHDRKAQEQAERFRPALEQFFDHYQPEPFAVEAVCLHRDLHDVGYGGTLDALVRIDGELWVVDWKSRNSDHAAYLEEAAQGGAYIGAQYMIVRGDDGNPQRIAVPDVAGVLIVSIRDDGYRAYPIDRDGAINAYHSMHEWWAAQRRVVDNKVIGRPWAPKATKPQDPPAAPDRRSSLVARIKTLLEQGHGDTLTKRWPAGVPGLGTAHPHSDTELDAIRAVVQRLEDDTSAPFHPDDTADARRPAERPAIAVAEPAVDPDGELVSADARADLNGRYAALPPTARGDVDNLRRHITTRTTPDGRPHVRQWSILRAAVLWAEAGWDNEILADLTAAVCDDDAVRQPGTDLGAAWAALTIDQANDLAEMAQRVLDGTHQATTHHDRWTLEPAA